MNIYFFIDTHHHHHHHLTTSACEGYIWRKQRGGMENRKLLEDLKCTRLPTNTHYDMLGWPFQLTPMSTYTCVIVCVSYYDASPTQAALKSKQSVSGDLGISEYEYLEETSRSWRSSTTTAASRPQHTQQMLLKQTHTHTRKWWARYCFRNMCNSLTNKVK